MNLMTSQCSTVRARLCATLMGLTAMLIASWPAPVAAQGDDCFSLPNGTRFCRPARVDELTQCVRSMQASPTLRPAEACRMSIVKSCARISDRDFERQYKVRRPRQIEPKPAEMTAGWNRYCPTNAGYTYVQNDRKLVRRPVPVRKPVPARGTRPGQNPGAKLPARGGGETAAIQEAGGYAWLIEALDAGNVPTLAITAACTCRDGSEPVYGFCTDSNGTYKPNC